MGFRVNTNMASLNAQRSLRRSKLNLDKSLEKLASGQRINKAGDDPSGLATSEHLKAKIRGLKQTKKNSEDGISLVQIGEGALSEVSNILIRLRELAMQAASDTIGAKERKFSNIEFQHLKSEVDRIIMTTEFNGVPLLNSAGSVLNIQVGTGNNPLTDRITLDLSRMSVNTKALGFHLASILDKASSRNSLNVLDRALPLISEIRSGLGAVQSRLFSTVTHINMSVENLSAANSKVRDSDIAKEAAEMTRGNILLGAGTSVLAQANRSAGNILGLLNATGQM